MLNLLQNWKGSVQINGQTYGSVSELLNSGFKPGIGPICIKLYPKDVFQGKIDGIVADAKVIYRITVKKYMTQKASPEFDFMKKWNNDVPMPFCTMIGEKIKETRGMVYMKLHADIYAEKIHTCMKCGRVLTNPVSQYFGIGPECGGHNYVNPFSSKEALKEAVNNYRRQLQNVTWEGWIIKSAIKEEVIQDENS